MEYTYQLVVTTCPDEQAAQDMAYFLIKSQLAACINIVPQVRSIYRWNGEIVNEGEAMLLIKTRQDRYVELEKAIQEKHPYETPEVIALSLTAGSSPYLAWVTESLTQP